MTRSITATAVLLISVILSFYSFLYINSFCNEIGKMTEDAIEYVCGGKIAEARNKLTDIQSELKKRKNILNVLVNKDYYINIQTEVDTALFHLTVTDYTTAITHLRECKTEINRLTASNTPSASTIF